MTDHDLRIPSRRQRIVSNWKCARINKNFLFLEINCVGNSSVYKEIDWDFVDPIKSSHLVVNFFIASFTLSVTRIYWNSANYFNSTSITLLAECLDSTLLMAVSKCLSDSLSVCLAFTLPGNKPTTERTMCFCTPSSPCLFNISALLLSPLNSPQAQTEA